MPLTEIKVKACRAAEEACEVLVLLLCEGERTWRDEAAAIDRALGGALRRLVQEGEFEGKANQTALFHAQGKVPVKRVLLVGLGSRKDLRLDLARQAMGTAAKRVRQLGARSFHAVVPSLGLSGISPLEVAQALVEGAVLGTYEFTTYRTEKPNAHQGPSRLTLITPAGRSDKEVQEGVRRGRASAEATWLVRDLCNHPSNVMTPARIAKEAKIVAKERGVTLKVLERRDLERLGMGALLGVGQGSQEPPKLVVLDYAGPNAGRAARPVVLVGKTITFDTGGISLKPSENMEQMKADMTGGAEVLAAVRAAARLRLPLRVVALLPAAENMPGGRAIKPGDILTTLSGKTVEVQNTDAEGRLILADGLAYATRYKPRAIIDVATLTGACIVALGKHAIGMFGNDEGLKQRVRKAGEDAGERVWEMPLWPEYFEQLKSDVADMRNIGGRPAGMITAAVFLSKFVDDHAWVHLDIASTDWGDSERPYIAKGPTGVGTRLLLQYLLNEAAGGRA